MSMRSHLPMIMAGLPALIAMSGGCAGSGGSNEGLILRHLSLEHWGHVGGYDANPMVLVVRDAACWSLFVGPEDGWFDQALRDEALDVDFENEMVIVAMMSGGCGIDCKFLSATRHRGRIVVGLRALRGSLSGMLLPCESRDQEAIVVPRSDEWVTVHELSIFWPFVFARTYYAAENQGTCTQPAP